MPIRNAERNSSGVLTRLTTSQTISRATSASPISGTGLIRLDRLTASWSPVRASVTIVSLRLAGGGIAPPPAFVPRCSSLSYGFASATRLVGGEITFRKGAVVPLDL